ncbi:MAG: hypothetical protein AUG46_12165 [Acidobacteria bacterium 13_1_20CM_3_58_11]|nr:MAG: hypothetical protein AUG46_12165 [Acidobacteria bacterium 13_1_20CM_3_58_11]
MRKRRGAFSRRAPRFLLENDRTDGLLAVSGIRRITSLGLEYLGGFFDKVWLPKAEVLAIAGLLQVTTKSGGEKK